MAPYSCNTLDGILRERGVLRIQDFRLGLYEDGELIEVILIDIANDEVAKAVAGPSAEVEIQFAGIGNAGAAGFHGALLKDED